jgi:gliding motility-associated-like protein
VTVTDAHGCIATTTTVVGQPGPLGIVTAQTNAACFGGNGTVSVTAVTGVAPYTYAWSVGVINPSNATSPAPSGNYIVTVTDVNGCMAIATTFVGQPGALAVNTAQTDAPCFGGNGTVSAFASSGTPPYNYIWPVGVIIPGGPIWSAPSGNYTVTATDANGCMATATTFVGQPGPLGINVSQTNAACYNANGSVSVTAITGVAPYTYAWSAGVINPSNATSPAPSGNYGVTVTDANGCMATASTVVGQPGPLGINTAQTDALCFAINGAVSAFAGSGTTPYTYTWSTGVVNPTAPSSPAPAGNYTVTVVDANGCSSTATTYVGQPGPLGVIAFATDTTYYLGDVVTLAISQPSAGTYTWVNGTQTLGTGTLPNSLQVTPQAAQNYTYMVTVTTPNNCTGTATVSVNIKLASMAMPSVFSPNGDGQNDKFYIVIAGEAEVKEFYVYNRWGQLVHSGATPWDGTFNGEPQPVDTYVYRAVIKQNGKETQMSGDFLLMR